MSGREFRTGREANMSLLRVVCGLPAAAAVLIVLTSQGLAHVGGTALSNAKPPPRYCSGAFRYAARMGNADIVAVAPAQAFAETRRVVRALRRTRLNDDVATGLDLNSRTGMCG
jgi:hypothetical protein